MSPFRCHTALKIFVVAAVVRFIGVGVTVLTGLNPDHGTDTAVFANTAQAYASGEIGILFFFQNLGSTSLTWGFFISPFWLLPGPSELYAQFAIALVGAFIIYNIYVLIEYHITKQAAIVATVPLIFLPSFVAIHSVILRDAAILCGFTYATRILTVPNRLSNTWLYFIVGGIFVFISLLRLSNFPIYVAMFLIGYMTWRLPRQYHMPALGTTAVSGIIAYPILERLLQWIGILRGRSLVDFLLFMRNARIAEGGRTQYLAAIPVENFFDLLFYASLGAFYFLFVPFPWMIETVVDYVTVLESMVMLFFAIFAIRGVATLGKRHLPVTVALVVGFLLFAFFYGVVSTNVGTSVRQRQIISWMIFAFGGTGLAQYFDLKIRWRQKQTLEVEDTHPPNLGSN